jgi:hypothetical protein
MGAVQSIGNPSLPRLNIQKIPDTCSPNNGPNAFQTYRIYTTLIPVLLVFLVLECIFIIANIPGTLGTSLTIKGSLPQLPPSLTIK